MTYIWPQHKANWTHSHLRCHSQWSICYRDLTWLTHVLLPDLIDSFTLAFIRLDSFTFFYLTWFIDVLLPDMIHSRSFTGHDLFTWFYLTWFIHVILPDLIHSRDFTWLDSFTFFCRTWFTDVLLPDLIHSRSFSKLRVPLSSAEVSIIIEISCSYSASLLCSHFDTSLAIPAGQTQRGAHVLAATDPASSSNSCPFSPLSAVDQHVRLALTVV